MLRLVLLAGRQTRHTSLRVSCSLQQTIVVLPVECQVASWSLHGAVNRTITTRSSRKSQQPSSNQVDATHAAQKAILFNEIVCGTADMCTTATNLRVQHNSDEARLPFSLNTFVGGLMKSLCAGSFRNTWRDNPYLVNF
jgi:hypothetical protein